MALDRRANLRIFFPFSRTSYMILPSSSLIFHPPLLYSSNNVSIFVTTSWIAFVIQDSPCPPCSFKTDWLSLSRLLSASCHKLRGELPISVAVGWRADGMMGFEPWVEAVDSELCWSAVADEPEADSCFWTFWSFESGNLAFFDFRENFHSCTIVWMYSQLVTREGVQGTWSGVQNAATNENWHIDKGNKPADIMQVDWDSVGRKFKWIIMLTVVRG